MDKVNQDDSFKVQSVSEHAGFPNPATDRSLISLDITKLLIQHPASTFFMRADGNEGETHGIFSGDIVIIDRALPVKKTDLVIWWQDDSFTLGPPKKVPGDVVVWGVVTNVIHRYRP